MAETQAPPRPSTPPQSTRLDAPAITPEQIRRREEQRLKAKALREQRDAETAHQKTLEQQKQQPTNIAAGQKRSAPFDGTRASERSVRDARQDAGQNGGTRRPYDEIIPAKNFARSQYIEYDFSAMTDTKGGFLTADDDPFNKALHSNKDDEEKPAQMTQREWERAQLDKRMREQRSGPYARNFVNLNPEDKEKIACQECQSLDVDWNWVDIFAIRVCGKCKEEKAEKYSLLTKSEAREDYLLTDPELKDTDLLPRLEKPNPHKSTWQPMQLFLRCQVEEYAFSEKKWGSGEALDREFERRQADKKKRKEDKFRSKLRDLKKRTRVEAYRRGTQEGGGGGGAKFGDAVGAKGKHEHEWGRIIVNGKGESVRRCLECQMEVEELEF